MGFRKHNPRPTSPPTKPTKGKEEVLLLIPNAIVHLAGDPNASAVEVGRGYLTVCRITEDGVALATVIKVGEDLRWPLTKDEPVAKLDRTHYLFSIPDKDGSFLNYGVSFAGEDGCLASFDRFLMENACFSAFPSADSSSYAKAKNCETYWKDYAPKIEDYNGALAKAIAQGTGEIVKGIFKLSDAYSTQVQMGANLIRRPQVIGSGTKTYNDTKRGGINKALQRARKLSETTEKMSRALLSGVLAVSESLTAPVVRSQAAKSFFAAVPGEILLASLDAISKVLDATEAAERRALATTSGVVAGAVCKRFGERAGEAADDAFATAGHAIGTAWNVFRMRSAFNPKSSLASAMVNNAARRKA
ncbi:hypothetical protein HPP92_022673 [Vanilla planifolia]|uniref:Senescence domain-containing protein n=1 Tax=Vanilla planifolia TaxID=51239 RepID=A0A835PSN9_VANPL|nr:hypothetical protein HPP92_022673 [Vanilla planifolia]